MPQSLALRRILALMWLAVVLASGAYLGLRWLHGLNLRTDLAALLPHDETDPAVQHANEAVANALARRVIVVVGHRERDTARAAAVAIETAMATSEQIRFAARGIDSERLRGIGATYFPFAGGLLSEADRRVLMAGQADRVAQRALAQVFGPVAFADANLLKQDPFLLLPAFLTGLPVPLGRLAVDDGRLTAVDDGVTWIVLVGTLTGSPYDLELQRRLGESLDAAIASRSAAHPGLEVLRLGAVFFAREGARTAMDEVDDIGTAAVIGSLLLVLLVFRSLTPLFLTQLSIGIGLLTGFATALLLFGDLHVMSVLLGLSLIGVVADYSFYYCAEVFAPDPGPAPERLARVLPAITLGLVTTLAGYAILMLAPLPGLRQLAVIALAGLIGAFATVVLWMPVLDRSRPRSAGRWLEGAGLVWRFWETPRLRPLRIAIGVGLGGLALLGLIRFTVEDDVRRLQTLHRGLVQEQQRIQSLAGASGGNQFFLVRAADDESALQRDEALAVRLAALRDAGALAGWRSPASFVPSAERQRSNRALVHQALGGERRIRQLDQLGLDVDTALPLAERTLTLAEARRAPVLDGILAEMLPAGAQPAHLVMLDGVTRPADLRAAADGLEGVRFIDPAGDFSELFARYRHRAMWLVAIAAVLVTGMVAFRFGVAGSLRVMMPALAAAALAPLLRAAFGAPFTFFDAVALVLILGINVDYAIFCAESPQGHRAVTLLAVWMTMVSTLMSFGLLALSGTAAVRAFGLTTAIGVALAALLAPLAAPRRGATTASGP